MDDHYDHNQTLVPESFLALHSRQGRAVRPKIERYPLPLACALLLGLLALGARRRG